MKSEVDAVIAVPLTPTADQSRRLGALQAAFSQVCNRIAPLVAQTGVWNRVALHHMAYRPMREQFPELGAQMVCNAIYAVSRTCRHVFQSTESPYHLTRLRGHPLPVLRFSEQCPVYLDRNTFSLKRGQASLFTLDGRMRFALQIGERREAMFHSSKLLEILLLKVQGRYTLKFHLQIGAATLDADLAEALAANGGQDAAAGAEPAYLAVDGQPLPLPAALAHGRAAAARPRREDQA